MRKNTQKLILSILIVLFICIIAIFITGIQLNWFTPKQIKQMNTTTTTLKPKKNNPSNESEQSTKSEESSQDTSYETASSGEGPRNTLYPNLKEFKRKYRKVPLYPKVTVEESSN